MAVTFVVEENKSMHSEFEGSENQNPKDPQEDPSHGSTGDRQNNLFDWLRGLNLQRQTQDRWITGVASGIARKLGVDPLIIRGVFVVLALAGGAGALLYLLAWLFLPNQANEIHFEDLVRGRRTRPEVIIICVILAVWIALEVFGRIRFDIMGVRIWEVFGIPEWLHAMFSGVFLVAIGVVVAYFVYRANVLHRDEHDFQETHATRRLKSGRAQALITVALALILAGLTALWVEAADLGTASATSSQNAGLVAALLVGTAVVAISMIIAGIRGSSLSGIGFTGFVGVVVLLATAVLPSGSTYHVVGNHSVTEPTPAAFSVVGNTDVDLAVYDTELDQQELAITHAFGEVVVHTSDIRPTELTVDVGAGSIEAPTLKLSEQSGLLSRRSVILNENADGPTLHVHVRLAAGTVTVE